MADDACGGEGLVCRRGVVRGNAGAARARGGREVTRAHDAAAAHCAAVARRVRRRQRADRLDTYLLRWQQ